MGNQGSALSRSLLLLRPFPIQSPSLHGVRLAVDRTSTASAAGLNLQRQLSAAAAPHGATQNPDQFTASAEDSSPQDNQPEAGRLPPQQQQQTTAASSNSRIQILEVAGDAGAKPNSEGEGAFGIQAGDEALKGSLPPSLDVMDERDEVYDRVIYQISSGINSYSVINRGGRSVLGRLGDGSQPSSSTIALYGGLNPPLPAVAPSPEELAAIKCPLYEDNAPGRVTTRAMYDIFEAKNEEEKGGPPVVLQDFVEKHGFREDQLEMLLEHCCLPKLGKFATYGIELMFSCEPDWFRKDYTWPYPAPPDKGPELYLGSDLGKSAPYLDRETAAEIAKMGIMPALAPWSINSPPVDQPSPSLRWGPPTN